MHCCRLVASTTSTWIELVMTGLQVLQRSLPEKLPEMPPPRVNLKTWWSLICDFPNEWKDLVQLYFTTSEDYNFSASAARVPESREIPALFSCELCGYTCDQYRKLANHRWAKHRIKCDVSKFIGHVTRCPACQVEFHERVRLIRHLSERRIRSKHRTETCSQVILSNAFAPVSAPNLYKLELKDAEKRKQARRMGFSSVLSTQPALPTSQHILKRRRDVSFSFPIPHPPLKKLRVRGNVVPF